MTKKEIYAEYGVMMTGDHILSPVGEISPLLKNGNDKVGHNVWTWSTLPGTKDYTVNINGETVTVKGTCKCDCIGCYAQTGQYNRPNTKQSMAINTVLIRNYPDFVKRAIIAQIHADKITLCRIHAAGDFDTDENTAVWKAITTECPNTFFWTYTKNRDAENAFDSTPNCNIVKSIIPQIGFNFGHCDYILSAYDALMQAGKRVHLCKCGFDKNQHCVNCKGCIENEFVLFVEHSTAYKAEKDPLYETLKAIAMNGGNE